MNRHNLLALICAVVLTFPIIGYGHSFSTSFLTVTEDGLIKYQLSFHDLAALNPDWLEEKSINKGLLNEHIVDIEKFLQSTVILNNQDCNLKLIEDNPWSSVSFAKQKYIVISARSTCAAEQIDRIAIKHVWKEFPDHKVISEISLPNIKASSVVLSKAVPLLP